jgi:hypothetical protein
MIKKYCESEDKSRVNKLLTIQAFLGRIQIESKVKYATNPNRIIICDLAGRTTRTKSHICKTRLIDYQRSQHTCIPRSQNKLFKYTSYTIASTNNC